MGRSYYALHTKCVLVDLKFSSAIVSRCSLFFFFLYSFFFSVTDLDLDEFDQKLPFLQISIKKIQDICVNKKIA